MESPPCLWRIASSVVDIGLWGLWHMGGERRRQVNVFHCLAIMAIGIFLSACSAQSTPLWLDSDAWGRAFYIADLPQSESMDFVEGDNGEVYFLVPDRDGEAYTARVIAIDEHIEQIWQQESRASLPRPIQIDLFFHDDHIIALWAGGDELHLLTFDPARVEEPSTEIITADFDIYTFAADITNTGSMFLLAAGSEEQPGLYVHQDDSWTLLDPLGLAPSLQLDSAGERRLVWWHDDRAEGDNGLYYTVYSGDDTAPGDIVKLTEISLNPADGIEGPFFGIEDNTGYIFWTQLFRTGLRAGTIEARYLSFNLMRPLDTVVEATLMVPDGYHFPYTSFLAGELRAGFRYSWLPEELNGTSNITDIQVLDHAEGELALALRARTAYLRRKMEPQVAVLYLDEGEPTSYQLLSFTAGNSSRPVIHVDEVGYPSVAWVEDGSDGGGRLYFTSREPTRQRALEKLEWADFQNALVDTALGLVSGLMLIPFALIWFVMPIVMIFVTSRLRKESHDLRSPGEIVSLLLVIATYWLGRQVILPGMWTYVPFSAWWPMLPPVMGQILPWLTPFVIAIGSFVLAWKYTYESGQRSFLYLSLLYLVVDAVITMGIYGGIIIDAF